LSFALFKDANCVMRHAAGTPCSNVTAPPEDEVGAPEEDDDDADDSPFEPEPVVELVHASSAATLPNTQSPFENEGNRIMTPLRSTVSRR